MFSRPPTECLFAGMDINQEDQTWLELERKAEVMFGYTIGVSSLSLSRYKTRRVDNILFIHDVDQ